MDEINETEKEAERKRDVLNKDGVNFHDRMLNDKKGKSGVRNPSLHK